MMKQIILFVLLSSLVVAQTTCESFAQKADDYVTNPSLQAQLPYPIDFAIAQEYFHAAQCFEKAGDSRAQVNYDLASNHYLIALQALEDGTDYHLKARTYEMAAQANSKLGKFDLARDYYARAEKNYNIIGMTAEANNIKQLLISMESTPSKTTSSSSETKNTTGFQNWIVVILLILLLPVIYEAIKLFENNKSSPALLSDIHVPKQKKHNLPKHKEMEHPRSAPKLKTRINRSKQARERLKNKLRSKYKR